MKWPHLVFLAVVLIAHAWITSRPEPGPTLEEKKEMAMAAERARIDEKNRERGREEGEAKAREFVEKLAAETRAMEEDIRTAARQREHEAQMRAIQREQARAELELALATIAAKRKVDPRYTSWQADKDTAAAIQAHRESLTAKP